MVMPLEPDAPTGDDGAPLGASPEGAVLRRWVRAYLRHAPLSLAIRELNRLIAIHRIEGADAALRDPVLDVGCGDGFWWSVRGTGGRRVLGIDVSAPEVKSARGHIDAVVADVAERPPSGGPYRQIIGNCSLEHVRAIDSALKNLRAVAADDAQLVMFVPAPQWAYQGVSQSWLLARMPRVAMSIAGALNGFFQHWHLYELPVWQQLLAQNGWKVRGAWGVGSARSEFLFRLFLPASFAGFLVKQIVGVYPERALAAVPDRALAPLEALATWALASPIGPAGSAHAYEYAILATPDRPRGA
jgi:SAM-dependent methyltransferase